MRISTQLSTRGLPVLLLAMLMCLSQSACHRGYDGAYLQQAVFTLKDIQSEWVKKGRPETFDPNTVTQPVGGQTWFVYTNTAMVGDVTYHCRFGARKDFWPPGVLAITDEGVTVWIRDRDGAVTLTPEKRFIDP